VQDRYAREEEKQRAQAWYAIMGLGALTAGVLIIMQYLPNNPFNVPSELPGTSRLNSDAITGSGAGAAMPLLSVTPSQRAAVGPGCRVSDIALVQEHRNALRQTVSEGILARAERGRFEVVGWQARGGGDDAGAELGCVVEFSWREGRAARVARWNVSLDRLTVTPADDRSRALSAPFRRSR
jgi:hypothetical protein